MAGPRIGHPPPSVVAAKPDSGGGSGVGLRAVALLPPLSPPPSSHWTPISKQEGMGKVCWDPFLAQCPEGAWGPWEGGAHGAPWGPGEGGACGLSSTMKTWLVGEGGLLKAGARGAAGEGLPGPEVGIAPGSG